MDQWGLGAIQSVAGTVAGPEVRLFPGFALTSIVIACLVYFFTKPEISLVKWLFPKAVWRHPSTALDVKLFAIGRVLSFLGLFNQVAVSGAASVVALSLFNGRAGEGNPASPLLIGFVILLVNDFAVYWVHRLHHELASLWPFHALHHSAEVMTPFTAYRKHPVYDLISATVRGLFFGFVQGTILAFFFGPVSMTLVLGVNAFYFLFNLLGSNLRHTHIWLSYGRVLEHVVISPAQHQIHHSRAPEHHNKNYGEVLAVWDWLFRTLYVPERQEVLDFGLSDENGHPLPQPHCSLREALLEPIVGFAAPFRPVFPSLRRK